MTASYRTYLSLCFVFLIHAQVEGAPYPLLSSSSIATPSAGARTDHNYLIKLLLIGDSRPFRSSFLLSRPFFQKKKKIYTMGFWLYLETYIVWPVQFYWFSLLLF